MIKGLYFYKLVSPYEEDVTKDCKLTINEIDSNFLNLKNVDINNAYVDDFKKEVILTRENGEQLVLNLSELTKHELDINYEAVDGVIEITYDGVKHTIKGLVTKDNLSKEILTKVYSDSTLKGVGTSANPLGISSIQKTGSYKAAIKVLDTIANEHLPNKNLNKGDRYVTLEEVSNYGLLYNFNGVKRINELLSKTGWRVATKDDWDSMLNAIEPCEYRNHNSTLNNRVLGHMAGTLLKSTYDWRTHKEDNCDDFPHHKPKCHEEGDLIFNSIEDGCDCSEKKHHLKPKPVSVVGRDVYGMKILPGGYAYNACPTQYNQFGFQGAFWTTDTLYDTGVYTKVFEANESGVLQMSERPNAFLSIRLVKDYDGTNCNGVEDILGDNYNTILMPSLNNPNGYAIWTTQNFRLREKHLETLIPNAGLGVPSEKRYFVNEWNGFSWDKIELEEGDSIVILHGRKWNEVHRVVEGKLINVSAYVIDNLRKEIKTYMDGIYSRIFENEHAINDICKDKHEHHKHPHDEVSLIKRIMYIEDSVEAIKWHHHEDVKKIFQRIADLSQENSKGLDGLKDELNSKMEELDEKISSLEETIKNVKSDLESKIEEETTRAQEKEDELVQSISNLDEKFEDALNTEKSERQDADNAIQNSIDNLESVMNSKFEELDTKDEELQKNIDTEQVRAQNAEQELESKIEEETKRAETIETEIKKEIEKLQETSGIFEGRINELEETTTRLDNEMLVNEGSNYDETTGILTLKSRNGESDITIKLGFNFGTF